MPTSKKDSLFRLSLSTLAMTLPFLVTLALAKKDRRRHALSLSGKIGFAIAMLSLALAWSPVSDGITRWNQSRNMAMRDVAAPPFDTLDLYGQRQRLGVQYFPMRKKLRLTSGFGAPLRFWVSATCQRGRNYARTRPECRQRTNFDTTGGGATVPKTVPSGGLFPFSLR